MKRHLARAQSVMGWQSRLLSGTVERLPVPVEPWHLLGGDKWAKGATEHEYFNELNPGQQGCDATAVQKYLANDEIIVVDEEWDVSVKTYAELAVRYERERMKKGAYKEAIDMQLQKVRNNFLVRYPNNEHMETLHKQATRGISKVLRRRKHLQKKDEKIPTFHMWCHVNYPPDRTAQLPVSELLALRDSYRRYLEGVWVTRLDEDLISAKRHSSYPHAKRYYYRPLHKVRLPEPSVLEVLRDRLLHGKNFKRISRVLEVNAGAALQTFLLAKHGIGHECLMLTDPAYNNIVSARWNFRSATSLQKVRKRSLQKIVKRPKTPPRMVAHCVDGFPTVEQCRGKDFQLILHTLPGTAEAPDAQATERSAEVVKTSLLSFMEKADTFLAPNGRVVITCDNLASINGEPDPISEIFAQNNDVAFEVEYWWSSKPVKASTLGNPHAIDFLDTKKVQKKQLVGLAKRSEIPLPPGPFRQEVILDRIKDHMFGRKSRKEAWAHESGLIFDYIADRYSPPLTFMRRDDKP
ncbi:hypothetical protein DIPPA_24594 [Diplonema papillatum]|nr:hypothetical protein DIPPA_24594 [Diplonema papillatum]